MSCCWIADGCDTSRLSSAPSVFASFVYIFHIELRPRDGDVSHAAVQQFAVRLRRVNVDQHAVGSLPLAAVARHRVAVVQMRMLPR